MYDGCPVGFDVGIIVASVGDMLGLIVGDNVKYPTAILLKRAIGAVPAEHVIPT